MSDLAKISEEYIQGLLQAGQTAVHQFADIFANVTKQSPSPPKELGPYPEAIIAAGQLQQSYIEHLQSYWKSILGWQSGEGPQGNEPRGGSPAGGSKWRNPSYELLRQSYLTGAKLLTDFVDTAEVDDRTRMHLRFFARQYVDAMSPENFLATNPDAIKLAIETKGESLAAGLRNLVDDMQKGRISMTDETAFAVGGNLAVTPGTVVFENELIQLIQYTPLTETVSEFPLLIVPPTINKFYVLDLGERNSFVRYVVEQGYEVFLISWRNVTPELDHLTWDDYLELGIFTAIDIVEEIMVAKKMHALGFCVGGTLLACASAVQRGRGDDKLASLTLLATMLDFSDTGEIGIMVDETYVRTREMMIGKRGILPGKELAFVFSTLRANDLIWPYVVNNYLKGATPDAFDLLFWNSDSTNLPGPMYCWYIRNTYLENNIRVPQKTMQCGVAVDLSKIDMPIYVLATREDHIVPWRTAYASTRLLGGEVKFVLGASGHIAGVVNPPARKKRSYWVEGTLGSDGEAWLATAKEIPGSWWPDWIRWIRQHSPNSIRARTELGSGRRRPIEPAPGRYVKARSE